MKFANIDLIVEFIKGQILDLKSLDPNANIIELDPSRV